MHKPAVHSARGLELGSRLLIAQFNIGSMPSSRRLNCAAETKFL